MLIGTLLLGLAVDGTPRAYAAAAKNAPQRGGPHRVWMTVTAYCPCTKCCGRQAKGITASGASVRANGSKFVAADTRLLPFGTKVSVPGYNGGTAVPVLDTGSKIKGHRLDVYFSSHQKAMSWGSRYVQVTVGE